HMGLQRCPDAMGTSLRPPAERPLHARTPEGEEVDIAMQDGGAAAAFIWKTVADPFAGRITLLRVIAGTLKADTSVHNTTRHVPERLGHLLVLQGKTQTTVPEVKAGDIGGGAQPKETQTDDA